MPRPQIQFKGGRLPAQPARPHLKLGSYLNHAKLPAAPASADWLSQVPADAWGMLANSLWGDCTCAGVGHKRIGDVYVNQGTVLAVTDTETLGLYSAVTGFNPAAGPPGDNPTDRGSTCQSVLEYWHQHGFLGESPVAFAKVDISDRAELQQAIAFFGQLYCGLEVPQSAEAQFNAGQPWTVVEGSPLVGGHCVTVGAYSPDGLSAVTWGAVQPMTWAFFEAYFAEAWVVIGKDFINSRTAENIQGLSLYQLGADFAALTGGTNPIPAPGTPPHPKQSLADEIRKWLEEMGL